MFTTMLALSAFAFAEEAAPPDPNGYYLGGRSGVAVPIDTVGMAFPTSLEAGIHFPSNLSVGLRFTFQQDPPEMFGYDAPWAVGPLIDGRRFFRINKNIELYGDLALGFIFGVDEPSGRNAVMPIGSAGIGARVMPGGSKVYIAPEIGVTSFTVPYMGLALGIGTKPVLP
jgi:hypothetical protein